MNNAVLVPIQRKSIGLTDEQAGEDEVDRLRIIVQKFGGTSVSSAENRGEVVKKIKEAIDQGFRVAVVVSAMGRYGDPYATDTLINLARQIHPHIKPRELDLLMACGENISTCVMTGTLVAAGLEAQSFTGWAAGFITDANFNDARIREMKPEAVRRCLEQGKIAVVAGFQGATPDGEITTLGRGGSDTSAVALGVALHAEVVEIYTDVEGVLTADPRLVPEAKPLATMTYNEVCEMAYLGAKVVHPRAVEIGMEGRIPIRIRSTFSESSGTLITDGQSIGGVEIRSDRVVTGLAHIADVAQVKIISTNDMNRDGLALKVFHRLANAGISVDMIQVSPHRIAFIVQDSLYERTIGVLEPMGLELGGDKGFAKVSVVGAGMRGVPGVMARVVQSLYKAGIAIFQSTDSHTNISCLVRGSDMPKALQALHDGFNLGE
jgi:aspartate kinase